MKKIVISPGFGAGWSTWSDKPKEVAEYRPVIEFLEKGGDPNSEEFDPIVDQMGKDLGLDCFSGIGRDELKVVEVKGRYCIEEYDGSESVRTEIGFW